LNWSVLNSFETITLSYLQDRAPLLNREELKFILPISILDLILNDCQEEYHLLKINNEFLFKYSTNYYDTKDFKLYFDHHKGKRNRYKIRERVYAQNGLKFVEIKTKTNNNHTLKYRKEIKDWFEANDFIQDYAKIQESDLHQSLYSEYTRITLLHKEKKEKITFDFNLGFYEKQKSIQYNNIVIAEVKSEKITTVHFNEIMKKYKIRSGSLSKYCLGLVSLHPKLKKNNFKMMFNQITKANNNG
jgi:hypothetical protein